MIEHLSNMMQCERRGERRGLAPHRPEWPTAMLQRNFDFKDNLSLLWCILAAFVPGHMMLLSSIARLPPSRLPPTGWHPYPTGAELPLCSSLLRPNQARVAWGLQTPGQLARAPREGPESGMEDNNKKETYSSTTANKN